MYSWYGVTFTYLQQKYEPRWALNGVTFTYLQQDYEPRCTLNGVTFVYLQQKYKALILDSVVRAGLNSVKTGSKRAKNTCLSIPNGPGSVLEKRAFDPFLTHFWSQNGPFSRHFGSFQKPKPVATGSKWAKTTCLSIINGPGSSLEKRVFDPFLTHFWSQNGPFSRHFRIFHGPKCATTCSKRPKNTCLSIPSGLGTTSEKIIFFAPGTLVDPPLAPAVRGPGCPPTAPNDH